MAVEVGCSCGKALRFSDECAGRFGICPGCGNEVGIPGEKRKGSTLIIPLGPEDENEAVAPGRFARALDEPKAVPEKVTSSYLPDAYEVVDELVKFHCPCGQKVSAPLNARRASGRCPRCRRRLVLPRVTKGKEEELRPVGERAPRAPPEPPEKLGRCPRCGRIITSEADKFCPSCGSGLAAPPAARAGKARLVAGLVDLAVSAAAFSLTVWAARGALGVPWAVALGLAAGVAMWFLNGAGFALASSGRTFGMLAAGLRLDGKPSAGVLLKRTALSLAFFMWLRDIEGRSFADRKAGTTLAPRAGLETQSGR